MDKTLPFPEPNWMHEIPNLDKLLDHLNITFGSLDELIKRFNISYTALPTNLASVVEPENLVSLVPQSDITNKYSDSEQILLAMVVFYLLLVALCPMINRSKKTYGYLFDEFKYKILWPVVLGFVIIPVMSIKIPIDLFKMLFSSGKYNLHSIRDVFDNNKISIERDDNNVLHLEYGRLEKKEYPNLIIYDNNGYPIANGHGSCNHNNSDDEI
jgi:hypothetical protein